MRKTALLVTLAFLLAACADPRPPVGKWEGALDSDTTMIAARMEIGSDGTVKISAPELSGIQDADEDRRMSIRARLSEELAAGWDDIMPREFDFDGEIFRRPGGIAPQMEWDRGPGRMTLVLYLGKDPALRIPMRSVSSFSNDPFDKL